MSQRTRNGAPAGANDYWTLVRLALTILVLPACCCSIGAGWLAADTWFGETVSPTDEYDTNARLAEWRRLPEAPEPLQQLVGAGPFVVYAETASGGLLSCSRASRFDVNCWSAIDMVPEQPESGLECGELQLPEPPIGLQVTGTIRFEYCDYGLAGKAFVTVVQYVLTSDGHVWQWGIDRNDLAETPNLDRERANARDFGSMLGLLTPLVMLVLIWFAPALRGLKRIVRKRQA